jgi:hypothetical protein
MHWQCKNLVIGITGTVFVLYTKKMQQKMKKLILFACIATVAIASCKKDKTDTASALICTTATVFYGGDPEADGLGWILLTDTASFEYEKPDNFDDYDLYKVQNLRVDVCYVITDKDFTCFCEPPPKKLVHIISIKIHG